MSRTYYYEMVVDSYTINESSTRLCAKYYGVLYLTLVSTIVHTYNILYYQSNSSVSLSDFMAVITR